MPIPDHIFQELAALITRRDKNATFEYPGFLSIDLSHGYCLNSGTVNETWNSDIEFEDGSVLHSYDSDVPSTSTDVEAIYTAVHQHLTEAEALIAQRATEEYCAYCRRSVDRDTEALEFFPDGSILHSHCAADLRADGQLPQKEN